MSSFPVLLSWGPPTGPKGIHGARVNLVGGKKWVSAWRNCPPLWVIPLWVSPVNTKNQKHWEKTRSKQEKNTCADIKMLHLDSTQVTRSLSQVQSCQLEIRWFNKNAGHFHIDTSNFIFQIFQYHFKTFLWDGSHRCYYYNFAQIWRLRCVKD